MKVKVSHRPLIVLSAVLCVAFAFAFWLSSYHLFQLTQFLVYSIALLGLNLLTGYSGQISLGHGAFFGIGAYATAIAMQHAGLSALFAVPLAGAVCLGVGIAFGLPALRLEGHHLALATFALGIATPQLLKHERLERWTGGVQGVHLDRVAPPGPLAAWLAAEQWFYLVCLVVVVLLYAGGWNLVHSRTGRALIATRDHPIAATTMGVDTALHRTATFGVSALLTGVAGGLGALLTGFVAPDSFTIAVSINFLVGVVVGGVASILGNFAGAAFIIIVPNLVGELSDAAPSVIHGIVLIAVMILFPRGIAGFLRAAVARRQST
jgi:branched-chain amino acid transport system permease protein